MIAIFQSTNLIIFSKTTIRYKQFSTFICYGFSQPYRKASGTGRDASDFHNYKQLYHLDVASSLSNVFCLCFLALLF